MQPLSGNQRLDLLTCLMDVSCTATATRHASSQTLFNVPGLPSLLTFGKVQTPLRLPRKRTSERRKVVPTWSDFNILTWKCASRHNGVHFFDTSTSKSGPRMVLCAFWLRNVLRATTPYTFSTSQLLKVLRAWCVLYILTWKRALRHNGVHFFDISTAKSRPTLRCFVHFDLEMCFAPQRRAIFHLSSGQLAPHPPL